MVHRHRPESPSGDGVRENLLYCRCIADAVICPSRQVFEMEAKKKIVITPGMKLAAVMAAAVFCVMLVSFLWGPASN